VNKKIFQFETPHYFVSGKLKGKEDLLGVDDRYKK